MRGILGAGLVWSLVLAAVDTLCVRLAHPWRPVQASLFLQAVGLWLVFALLAALPARLCFGLLRRRRPDDLRDGRSTRAWTFVFLAGWMTLPVALHATLDRHVGLQGSFAALSQIRPWLELVLVLLAGVAALLLVGFLLRRVRHAPLGVSFAVLALLIGFFLPKRGAASSAAPSTENRPNLLLLVWDTCRADRLQPYGSERPTSPHLDRLAGEAVVFESSVSASCFTLTSHLSMLTGRVPSSHGARLLRSRYDPRKASPIAEVLRRAGYRTAAFVGTDVLNGRTGVDHGFEVYDDQVDPPVCDTFAWNLVHDLQAFTARFVPALRNNGQPHWIQDFQRPAGDVLAAAHAWIAVDDPRPWFCLVNLYDVHWPYVPGEEGRTLVGPYDGPIDGFLFRSDAWKEGYAISDEDRRHLLDLYDGEILELDARVDTFLGELDLDSGGTAVVLTSDHGEAFGEAGRWKHEDIVEPQVRVPLLVRPPEPAPEGRRVSAPTSGIDVAPTLLALAGIEPPPDMEGVDLLGTELDPERVILVEDRDHVRARNIRVALYRGPWKLVRSGLGEEARYELFDLSRDPIGEVDVAAEHPDIFAQLVLLLAERRAAADELEGSVSGDELTKHADTLRALGYGGE